MDVVDKQPFGIYGEGRDGAGRGRGGRCLANTTERFKVNRESHTLPNILPTTHVHAVEENNKNKRCLQRASECTWCFWECAARLHCERTAFVSAKKNILPPLPSAAVLYANRVSYLCKNRAESCIANLAFTPTSKPTKVGKRCPRVEQIHPSRYVKSASTRKATEAQGLKLARQLAVVRERTRADREALEVS